MTNWPSITVHGQTLGLPALPVTLDHLVRIVVGTDADKRQHDYVELFRQDPFCTVWLAALAWARGQVLESEVDLAEWMVREGEQVVAELDPNPADELIPPDAELSAAYLCQLVSTARAAQRSIVSIVTNPSSEVIPAEEQVANDLMKQMNAATGSTGPLVTFAGWQKVLNWDQRDELFSRQLHQKKMLAVKNFAYGASHEINNPLGNITSRAQNLVKTEEDPYRRRELSTIETQAHRASSMIADLMLFAHPPTLTIEPLRVNTLIKQVVREMREFTEPIGLTMEVREGEDVSIQADEKACLEVCKAIVQNSIDALEEGQIILSWKSDDTKVLVTIEDNGPLISEEQLDVIFDPYFSGREAGRGIGFGLTKAWRVMQLQHGDITVSNLKQGVATTLQFVKTPQ